MSTDNPLVRLKRFGQSVWLDYIQRDMLVNGEVARLIADDGLAGMTSNPAIFSSSKLMAARTPHSRGVQAGTEATQLVNKRK